MFLLRRLMMSGNDWTYETSGCSRYHSAKPSTLRRYSGSVMPPSRPRVQANTPACRVRSGSRR